MLSLSVVDSADLEAAIHLAQTLQASLGFIEAIELRPALVVTKRRGREKLHFLNPVPIRVLHDRWVSKYTEPWAAALSELKQTLEQSVEKVFEIYLRTTPERLWEAITDSEIRAKFWFGTRVSSQWTPGSHYEQPPRCRAAWRGGEHRG